MRQTLHIFKKDVRCLRYELLVTLLIVVAFTIWDMAHAQPVGRILIMTQFGFPLLPIAGWILVSRVIHAEALPGDRQFWLTRPYAWKSLLGAKALFILVFVNLPKLGSDAIIIHSNGFSLEREVPGLFWSQVLLTAAFVLPIAALSALTSGIVQLVSATLVTLLGVGLAFGTGWGPLDWIRYSYVVIVLALAAFAVVLWQYARRRTWPARFFAAAAGVFMVYGSVSIPLMTAVTLQSRFSKQPVDPSLLHVSFDASRKSLARVRITGDSVQIQLPLEITGVPDGMDAVVDGFSVSIVAPDGTVWPSNQIPLTSFPYQPYSPLILATVDSTFYGTVKDGPVRFRGSAYLTLVGNRRTDKVGKEPITVLGAGVCAVADHEPQYAAQPAITCRYPFRSPPRMVSAPSASESSLFLETVSYSPFAAELSISPISTSFEVLSKPISEAMVVTREPFAHILREFEITGLRLADFEVQPDQLR